jgi:uncharacterized protein
MRSLLFEAFIDFVTDDCGRYPDAHNYHYAPYEKTALKRLMSVHATREVEGRFVAARKVVDLYQVVRGTIGCRNPAIPSRTSNIFICLRGQVR